MAAIAAKMWGVRPSSLVTISDPVVAYEVDVVLASRLLQAQKPGQRAKADPDVLAAGLRYETARDLEGFDPTYQAQLRRVH